MRLLITLLICATSALYAADKVVGGPYVVNPAARSATIGWVVETDGVKTGGAPDQLTRRIPVLRNEKISMTGLKAGETVYYEIPGAGPLEERTGRFKVPPTGPASFQFVVFGDTRTRDDLHRRIVQAISKTDPDFVIHTGDLVADGYDTAQWPVFFAIERDLLRKTVFFPVLGNHERNNARFHEFFAIQTPYYSFNWGSAHFVLLNSDLNNVSVSPAERERFWAEQMRWMEDDLQKNQKADFRMVVMHHPALTAYQEPSHMSKDTPGLVPLFEKYKVTAVFAGHDHNYQHHLKNGIHYIVTGGGGAPLAPVDQPIPGITVKVESVEHYTPIQINGNRAHIQAIALDGHLIETIDLISPTAMAPASRQ
ncbi:MAG: metallophosphoesterase [Acidobacteriia bacterium]|nr:metallophosphoesterase [Terriglobia bacterium]